MITREITDRLVALFRQYPFVTLTGPRQAGKTTLCRAAFPHLTYVNLEAPDQRLFAESDPRGFLSGLGEGAILDEIQRVPQLLSYLQVLADDIGRNSLFRAHRQRAVPAFRYHQPVPGGTYGVAVPSAILAGRAETRGRQPQGR